MGSDTNDKSYTYYNILGYYSEIEIVQNYQSVYETVSLLIPLDPLV